MHFIYLFPQLRVIQCVGWSMHRREACGLPHNFFCPTNFCGSDFFGLPQPSKYFFRCSLWSANSLLHKGWCSESCRRQKVDKGWSSVRLRGSKISNASIYAAYGCIAYCFAVTWQEEMTCFCNDMVGGTKCKTCGSPRMNLMLYFHGYLKNTFFSSKRRSGNCSKSSKIILSNSTVVFIVKYIYDFLWYVLSK